jgi:hypothetical protein
MTAHGARRQLKGILSAAPHRTRQGFGVVK